MKYFQAWLTTLAGLVVGGYIATVGGIFGLIIGLAISGWAIWAYWDFLNKQKQKK